MADKKKISKHDFYFESPLYEKINRSKETEEFFKGDVDAYSALNKTETTYKIVEEAIIEYNSDWNEDTQKWVAIGYFLITLTCKRKAYDVIRFYIHKYKDKIIKVGQYPSLADLQFAEIDKKYSKVLSENHLINLKKAIGLASHNAGAGSFVYLRRIFEDLVLECFEENKKDLDVQLSEFKKMKMLQKIETLKSYLPSQLSAMKSVYKILGKGVHELTEQQCLKYFSAIKLSITLILDQKIEIELKRKKDLDVQKEIDKINNELSKDEK